MNLDPFSTIGFRKLCQRKSMMTWCGKAFSMIKKQLAFSIWSAIILKYLSKGREDLTICGVENANNGFA